MRLISSMLAGFVLVAACGGEGPAPGKTSAGAKASCAADDDCVIVAKAACCVSCPDQPRAIPKFAEQRLADQCAATKCAPASDRVECPKVDDPKAFVAKCSGGTCQAAPR